MSNKVENLRNFTFLSNPQTNQSQSLAAFVVSNIDYTHDRYINKLYTFDGRELKPLTEAGAEANYFFEDENNIIFQNPSKERYSNNKAEDTKEIASHYYRICVDGGEASYAFTIPLSVDKLLPLQARNKFLVLASYDLNAPLLWQKSAAEQQAYVEKHSNPNRPHIINEIPFQANGQGYLYNRRSALFYYDSITNELEHIGTDYPNYVINWLTLNANKTKAAFAATPYTGKDEYHFQPFAKLYELDLNSSEITELYSELDQQLGDGFYLEMLDAKGVATGCEALVLISSDTKDYGINQNNHFYLYQRDKQTLHKLANYEVIYGNSVGTDVTYGHNEASFKSSSSVYNLIETRANSTQLSAFTLVKTADAKYPTLKQEVLLTKTGSCLAAFSLHKDPKDVITANTYAENVANTCRDNLANTCKANNASTCRTQNVSRETNKVADACQINTSATANTSTATNTCVTTNTLSATSMSASTNDYSSTQTCSALQAANKSQSLFVLGLYEQELSELYLVEDKDHLLRLSYFNDQMALELSSIKPEKLNFTSPYKQTDIEGFVLLPPNFVKGKKASYPLILDIHGGPKTVYSSTYYHEMQVWASLGFVVCYTNPNGSDGRGNAFADIRGAYGGRDYDDLMTFLDKVLANYAEIDPERLGVTGGSYGGFMTNWIITHTKRFKAACSQRSISNWLSFYGTSDIGYYFATDQNHIRNFTLPEQEILWQHSPLKYINEAATPTLFIHSDNDYRCPLEQGMQMHTALRALGVPSKLCIFPFENHDLSRGGKPQAREWRLNLMTHWFLQYLQPDKKELIAEFQAKID